jgi:hypothetical protein
MQSSQWLLSYLYIWEYCARGGPQADFTFQSTHAKIFASHYSTKASKAWVIGHAILGVEFMIGSLPPYKGHKLYMARVDPHLTGGCEVVLDVHPLAQQLVDVQHSFLHPLLKVNNRAMIAPLFTETCVIPLQFCRAQLALQYLGYLISLPIGHMAHAALLDSAALFHSGNPCCINDLQIVLLNLPCAVSPPDLALIDADGIKTLDSAIVSSMKRWLDKEMESPKLYLLQGRLELEKDKPPQHKTLWFRHYLQVPTVAHRRALTCLLLSDHSLAIEQLRRSHGPYIPREN